MFNARRGIKLEDFESIYKPCIVRHLCEKLNGKTNIFYRLRESEHMSEEFYTDGFLEY